MNGKTGVAPCGHTGFHVTANYVTCSAGCDQLSRKQPAALPIRKASAIRDKYSLLIGDIIIASIRDDGTRAEWQYPSKVVAAHLGFDFDVVRAGESCARLLSDLTRYSRWEVEVGS